MKKNWTKILVALLTLAMILSLTGCPADDQPDESSKAPGTSAPDTPKESEKDTPADSETDKPTESEKETDKPTESEKETDKPTDTEKETDKPTDTQKPTDTPVESTPDDDKLCEFLTEFLAKSELIDGKIVYDVDGDFLWEEALKSADYLAMSGNAGKDKTLSEFTLNLTVTADAVLSFKAKVDTLGESKYDGLYIILDGAFYTLDGAVKYGEGTTTLGTETDGWKLGNLFTGMDASVVPYIFPNGEFDINMLLTEGTHSVRIGYLKDWRGGEGTDKAYISKATLTEYEEPTPPTPPTPEYPELNQNLTAPEFDFENAIKVECETATVMDGGSSGTQTAEGGATFGYVYMKKTVDNPKISITFNVPEDGTYDFVIALMAYNGDIPRTGLVQVDDGEKYYIYTLHGERHLVNEYYTGLTVELTKGEHTMNLYLADDFDNSTVKSTYFDYFCFMKQGGFTPAAPVVAYSETGARLDAYKDAAYTNGVEFIIDKPWANNAAGVGNGAKAWIINDGTGIYMYAEVEDTTYQALNAKSDGDMVQVYVDMVNDSAETGLTGDDYKKTGKDQNRKLGICWVGADGTYKGSWGFGGVAEVKGAARIIEGGYACELYIPFPENVNKFIGIGFEVHDDTDGNGKRDAIWYDRADGGGYYKNYEGLTRYEVAAAGEATVTAIPFSAKGLHLDAYKDVIYGANAIEVKAPWVNNVAGLEGGGVAYVAHDGTGLYYYAEIADLSILADADGNLDNSDKAQLYVDFLNNHDGTGLTKNDYRKQEERLNNLGWVNILPGGDMRAALGMEKVGYAGAYREIEGGYAVEVYVPFSAEILADLERGAVTTIGLGWQFDNDDDVEKPDNNKDSIFTDQEGGASYYNTYEMLRDFIIAPTSDWTGRVAGEVVDKVAANITVDGDKEDLYATGKEFSANSDMHAGAAGKPAVVGTENSKAWIVADANGLYIFADVTDGTPSHDATVGKGESDQFWFFVDFVATNEELGLSGDAYRGEIGKVANQAGAFQVYPDGSYKSKYYTWDTDKIQTAAKINENGYTCEIFLPFPDAVGNEIRFGFEIIDDTDADGAYDYLIFDQPKAAGLVYWSTLEKLQTITRNDVTTTEGEYVAAGIDVDAKMDKAYGEGWDLEYRWPNSHADAEGQTHVYMANDDNYLYIFADITDKTPFSTLEGNVHWADKIQIYIDFMNTKDTRGNAADYYHTKYADYGELSVGYVEVARDNAQRLMYTFSGRTDIVSATAEKEDGTGYYIEVAIPLRQAVKDTLAAGAVTTIQVGFQINDDIDGDATQKENGREGIYTDNADVMSAWLNYKFCPELRLS